MDIGTFVVGISLMALCILPFVAMSRIKKNKEKQLLKSLSAIANKYGGNIVQHEIFGNFIIGLDNSTNSVFFLKKDKEEEVIKHVRLTETKHCRVEETGRTISNKDGNHKLVDRLDLHFTPIDSSKPEVLMEFYNAQDSMQLSGELQMIRKWEKTINEQLKHLRE